MDSELIANPAKDARRETIVSIAHEEFLANGYSGTSMSAIAARVGGSKATLYNYFASKEELFVAVIERKSEEILRLMYEAEVEGGGEVRAALTRFGERFLQVLLSEQSIATYRLVTAESGRFPELGRALYNSGMSRGRKRLAEYFERAKETGQLRDADMSIAAEQFFDLCKSGIHHRRLWNVEPSPTVDDIRRNVAHAVTAFMLAYGA